MTQDAVLLTVEQAADVGNVPVNTIRDWIKRGRLDVVRKGRAVLIMRGTLDALLRTVCPVCGDRFRRPNLRAVFCSQRCRQRAHHAAKGAP